MVSLACSLLSFFAFSSLFVVCPICVPFKRCSMFALVAVLPALVLLFVSRFTSVIVFMVFWFVLVAFLPSPVCLLFCHICDHFKWCSMFALVAVLPALVLLFVSRFTSVIVFMVFWFVLVAFLPSPVCLLFCHICDHFKWCSMFALVAVLPALVLLFDSRFRCSGLCWWHSCLRQFVCGLSRL